jgi:RimJ/RimL family protein N-acetyltransferase
MAMTESTFRGKICRMFWRKREKLLVSEGRGTWSCTRHPKGDLSHKLIGNRVQLIPVAPPDLYHLIDEHVREGQGFTEDKENPFGAPEQSDSVVGYSIEFAICPPLSASPLGCVSLTICHRDTATLAYWMGPVGRDRGLTSEAAVMATRFALGHLGLHRVVADLSIENVASRRVAEHAGLVVIGNGSNTRPNGRTFESFLMERTDGPLPGVQGCPLSRFFSALPEFEPSSFSGYS